MVIFDIWFDAGYESSVMKIDEKIAELFGITPQQIYEHAISLYREIKKVI